MTNWFSQEQKGEPQTMSQVVFGWNPDGEGGARTDVLVDLAGDDQGARTRSMQVEEPTAGVVDAFRLAITASHSTPWTRVGVSELHLVCLPCPDELEFPALPEPDPTRRLEPVNADVRLRMRGYGG